MRAGGSREHQRVSRNHPEGSQDAAEIWAAGQQTDVVVRYGSGPAYRSGSAAVLADPSPGNLTSQYRRAQDSTNCPHRNRVGRREAKRRRSAEQGGQLRDQLRARPHRSEAGRPRVCVSLQIGMRTEQDHARSRRPWRARTPARKAFGPVRSAGRPVDEHQLDRCR